jgi:hypothetical protein
MHIEGEKRLVLAFRLTDDEKAIHITIDDNGIGRERSRALNASRTGHRSFSTDANAQRLDMLNKMLGQSARVEIVDKYDEKQNPCGTTVLINLPVITSVYQLT